jgi:hypothetical protein
MSEIYPSHAVAAMPALVPRLSRPVSRRHMLGIMSASATAVALYRVSNDNHTDPPVEAAPPWQAPPAYDGILGLL